MRVSDMMKKLSTPPSPVIWPKDEPVVAALPMASLMPEPVEEVPDATPVTQEESSAAEPIIPSLPEKQGEAPEETPVTNPEPPETFSTPPARPEMATEASVAAPDEEPVRPTEDEPPVAEPSLSPFAGVTGLQEDDDPLPACADNPLASAPPPPRKAEGIRQTTPISENGGIHDGGIWKDGDAELRGMWQAVEDFLESVRARREVDPAAVITTADILVESLKRSDDLVKVLFVKKESRDLASRLIDVAIVAAKIGFSLRYDGGRMRELVLCALLHDVGMLEVPESIVNKKGKLDEDELAEIRKHPQYGHDILIRVEGLPPVVAEVAYQEQEREDGSGYPLGLRGKSIHEYAKITGLAVLFTAMLQPRPQRARRIPFEVIKEIIDHNKAQFPLYLIRILIDELSLFPEGLYVMLNTGEIGKVLRTSRLAPMRPVIEIVRDAHGRPPGERREYDLMREHILRIEDALFEIT